MGVNYNICQCQNENHKHEENTMNMYYTNSRNILKNIPKKDFAFNSANNKINLNDIKMNISVDKIIKAYRYYKNNKIQKNKIKNLELNESLITFNKNDNITNNNNTTSNSIIIQNQINIYNSQHLNSNPKKQTTTTNIYSSNIINNENNINTISSKN